MPSAALQSVVDVTEDLAPRSRFEHGAPGTPAKLHEREHHLFEDHVGSEYAMHQSENTKKRQKKTSKKKIIEFSP
jgi:hypothetical protein